MNHSFNIEIAEKFGIEEAIILENIAFWTRYNIANRKNFYNEKYWIYNSRRAWHELFPYIQERTIGRILERLEKLEILVSGNFNKAGYDKTKWYSFKDNCFFDKYFKINKKEDNDKNDQPIGQSDQSIGQNDQCIGTDVQPIPIINTDINLNKLKDEISFFSSRSSVVYTLLSEYNHDLKDVHKRNDKNEEELTFDINLEDMEENMRGIANSVLNSEYSTKASIYVLTEYIRLRTKITGKRFLTEEKQMEYLKRFFEATKENSYRTVMYALHQICIKCKDDFKKYMGISPSTWEDYLREARIEMNHNLDYVSPKTYNPQTQKWELLATGENNSEYRQRILKDPYKKMGDI